MQHRQHTPSLSLKLHACTFMCVVQLNTTTMRPPAIPSAEFDADYAFTLAFGAINSTNRTAYETDTAKFWYDEVTGESAPATRSIMRCQMWVFQVYVKVVCVRSSTALDACSNMTGNMRYLTACPSSHAYTFSHRMAAPCCKTPSLTCFTLDAL